MNATRKVVINACYGGFSLSPAAIRRLAEMDGRSCYFFKTDRTSAKMDRYSTITEEEATRSRFWYAFDIPNPNVALVSDVAWHDMSEEERASHNNAWEAHALERRDIARDDPRLLQLIEELGEDVNGSCASLKVVEIPADVEWEIKEYDGSEWVAEVHRTWS